MSDKTSEPLRAVSGASTELDTVASQRDDAKRPDVSAVTPSDVRDSASIHCHQSERLWGNGVNSLTDPERPDPSVVKPTGSAQLRRIEMTRDA